MCNGNRSNQCGQGRPKVSVLVLDRESGWATEVAVRCNGQLKAYWRNDETVYPSREEARMAGYQWAEDFLRAQGGGPKQA